MQVKSFAECSKGSILQYFRPSLRYHLSLRPLFCLFLSGRLRRVFYGDLVYKFKRIIGKPNFRDQFKKILKCYIKVGYNFDIMRQSAYLMPQSACPVLNPITVYSYGFLFNCTMVGQASDSMTAVT